jgi:rfaE bifunctional protein kinase chain/domain
MTHIAQMIAAARKAKKRVLVDPKGDDYSRYRGASVITPNRQEFREVAGAWADERDLERRAEKLRRELGLEALLVTRGEEGMTLFQPRRKIHIKTEAREVFDVSGAGDTVISALAVMLAAGAGMESAVRTANRAAGIVVGKFGTAVATQDELFGK